VCPTCYQSEKTQEKGNNIQFFTNFGVKKLVKKTPQKKQKKQTLVIKRYNLIDSMKFWAAIF
jgi:hypothetical protein